MRILLDTNVLISAFVFGGTAGRLLEKLFDDDFDLLISDYVDKEFLEADLEYPLVLSPATMLDFLEKKNR